MCRADARVGLLLVAALCAASCYSRPRAPRLPDKEATYSSPYGSWVRVRFEPDSLPQRTGELIAVSADSVFVLDAFGLAGFDRGSIRDLRVERFRPGGAGYAVALGLLGTASHGLALILTAPAWIVVGGFAARSANNEYVESYRGPNVDRAVLYARFPQGLPSGVDRTRLGRPFGEAP